LRFFRRCLSSLLARSPNGDEKMRAWMTPPAGSRLLTRRPRRGHPAPAEKRGMCTRGKEEAPHSLPFPVANPLDSFFGSWCRDGDAFFYDKGMKAAEGKLVGGRPDGAWTYYYETGERLLSGRYINGDAEGLWRAYDPDGTVTQLGCFRAGKKRWGVTGDKLADGC
jgi:hypothetical protein